MARARSAAVSRTPVGGRRPARRRSRRSQSDRSKKAGPPACATSSTQARPVSGASRKRKASARRGAERRKRRAERHLLAEEVSALGPDQGLVEGGVAAPRPRGGEAGEARRDVDAGVGEAVAMKSPLFSSNK